MELIDNKCLTADQLCNKLKLNKDTLTRLRRTGMPSLKNGRVVRFDLDEVKKWMKETAET